MSERPAYDVAKRLLDITVALLLLPATLLLGLLCVLAIRLDSPGPAVFSQMRTGRDGRRFKIWKFRTMVENAEELKAELAHLNVLPPPDFKIPDDPRITRVGRFLRKTSLDELPQLLNVLRGDMSLVGPRPTSFAPSTYTLWHTRRLDVAPGLTGLWQVQGRHEMTFDERLRLDIAYIQQRSMLMDLRIIAATATSVLRGKGA
jgi:lipopolysaccharide/colanic/teichoic acid biosynthesis glycosyltransferase